MVLSTNTNSTENLSLGIHDKVGNDSYNNNISNNVNNSSSSSSPTDDPAISALGDVLSGVQLDSSMSSSDHHLNVGANSFVGSSGDGGGSSSSNTNPWGSSIPSTTGNNNEPHNVHPFTVGTPPGIVVPPRGSSNSSSPHGGGGVDEQQGRLLFGQGGGGDFSSEITRHSSPHHHQSSSQQRGNTDHHVLTNLRNGTSPTHQMQQRANNATSPTSNGGGGLFKSTGGGHPVAVSPSSVNSISNRGGDIGLGLHKQQVGHGSVHVVASSNRSTLTSPPCSMTASSSSSRSGSPRDGLLVDNNNNNNNSSRGSINAYYSTTTTTTSTSNNSTVLTDQHRIDQPLGVGGGGGEYQHGYRRDFVTSSPTTMDRGGGMSHFKQQQQQPRQQYQVQQPPPPPQQQVQQHQILTDYPIQQQQQYVNHSQQLQQQVLYIAAPTPDGRGQMLQPVQMVQVQGQPGATAFVVPSGTTIPTISTTNGGLVAANNPPHPPPQLMVIPTTTDTTAETIVNNNNNNNHNRLGGHSSLMNKNNNRNHDRYIDEGNGGDSWWNAQQQQQLQQQQQTRQFQQHDGFVGTKGGNGSRQGIGSWTPAPPSREDRRSSSNPPSPSYIRNNGQQQQPQQSNLSSSQDSNDIIASLYSAPQRPPLDALIGHIRRLSRDQLGCRLLQQALDEEGPAAATRILKEGLSFWGEAMVDPFGNYLFQKILEKITREERIMVVKTVSSRLINASLNLHGTRSVQKLVELCAADELSAPPEQTVPSAEESSGAFILTQALAPAAARLCIDSHGNHVIQRILLQLCNEHSRFVFDEVAASVGDVARHRHGCCVIQRCLDSPPSAARSHLVCRIVDNALELMQDAYGNYVVQYVLDVCCDDDVHAVCESAVGNICLLAIQKFSSNVMEKCLERCTETVKAHYLDELSDADRIRELMLDPFGNYVVQRALSVATHAQAVRLVEAMRPHLLSPEPEMVHGQRYVGCMRNTAGGRRIMAKICRRFPNFSLTAVASPEYLYCQHKVNIPTGNPALPISH